MDADHLDVGTAIGRSFPAGTTGSAVDIRLQTTPVTDRDVRHTVPHRKDLETEFMAKDARITKEGLPSVEGMVIGAAEPDAVDADHCLPGSGS
jgi:hypothetical protein